MITKKMASSEQRTDLMCFREVGESAYKRYVKHNILNKPTVNDPVVRKKKLLTFTIKESQKR